MRVAVAALGLDGPAISLLDQPEPTPAADELLVEVLTVGLNRGELIRREEASRDPASWPKRVGSEFVGRVLSAPPASRYAIGDRVMGRRTGSAAERIAARQDEVTAVPDGLADTEAAAVPVSYMTAHDALVANAGFRAGEAVLVAGAAAGVGIAAAQIARVLGSGVVIGTTRDAAKTKRLLAAGFDVVVDPATVELAVRSATDGRGVDVVIDNVGGPMLEANVRSMARAGRLVSVGRTGTRTGTLDLELLATERLRLIGVTFRTRTPQESLSCWRRFVEDLSSALTDGRLRPVIDRVFPFERYAEGEAYMLEDRHVGKIVVEITHAVDSLAARSHS